ncbi:lipid droplet-associated hydrolase-like [Mizuhopecten yessoensis]|uniref:lipid droplet-associated hydrolase-like n=1 Tax=Mizuhopecten yessoensis TaxID=6573 RepID=UPI000B45CA37|nr:lipid droplet-associated hydrolase-like [Mizuhopecten yessoensis]
MSSARRMEVPWTREFVPLNGVTTHIVKCGYWLQTSTPTNRLLFLIIPGNPGVIQYYERFMECLYWASEGEVPVWGVSHTGHVYDPSNLAKRSSPSQHESQSSRPSTDSLNNGQHADEPFTLKGQINNKIEFINKHVPEDVRLILLGHSIGCYMILKMLDALSPRRVFRCFLLFPTIERMAASPNGTVATPLLRWLRWLAVGAAHSISFLSPRVKYRLVLWHFGANKTSNNIPECIYNATMEIFTPSCLANVLFLANEEMQQVDKLDADLVSRHADKLCLYYGQSDSWCPREYFYNVRDRKLKCDIRLCNRGYEHAFVIKASDEMADIVWGWFQSHNLEESS